MAVAPLILVANPGSASRKYGLYEGDVCRAKVQFEETDGKVVCHLETDGAWREVRVAVDALGDAAKHVGGILREVGVLGATEQLGAIGLRVVAPSRYFQHDRVVDDQMVNRLAALEPRAPLHVRATLGELHALRGRFRGVKIVGVSDSAFHAGKPDRARYYGLPMADARRLELERYGYHGLSVASIVGRLRQAGSLPQRLIVCHLGSGDSVSAVTDGVSVDNTMGYSPLEGLVMATRSGSIDAVAVGVLGADLHLDPEGVEDYLNEEGGLLGLSGLSSDIRELIKSEAAGDTAAQLALETYVYRVQQGIAQMAVALGGIDAVAFTGTVGQRSFVMREHVTAGLGWLGIDLDAAANRNYEGTEPLREIGKSAATAKIYVVQTDESAEIARRVLLAD